MTFNRLVAQEKPSQAVSREEKLELQLRFQKRLHSITNKINSAKDTDDILLNLQEEILSLFDADRITIYIVDGVRKEIVSRFKTGNEVSEIRVPITKQSIAGYCALSGKVVNIVDAYDEDELAGINPELRFDRNWDQKSSYKTRQVLAVPIVHNKYRLGVAQLINKKKGTRFTAEDASSLLEIARVLGIAFFNNHRALRWKRSAKFDYLVSSNIITSDDLEQAMLTARKARKPVEKVDILSLGVVEGTDPCYEVVSLELPPEKAAGTIIQGEDDAAAAAAELVKMLRDEAKAI